MEGVLEMDIGVAPPLTVGFIVGASAAAGTLVLGGGVLGAFLAYSLVGAAGIVGGAMLAAHRLSDDGDDDDARVRKRQEEAELHPYAQAAFAGARAPGR
ncbi:hypothetical protein ACQ5SO_15170 [Rhodovulum sp. DZ06]|uniref:hypothetical protein n=1 Tax=Rhodovulum sp. DZ06 TaxID=3425126 RepID=UPI003D3548B2